MPPTLNVEIPEELDRRFRMHLTEKFGGRKGDLQRALIEALEAWVNEKPLQNLIVTARDVKAPRGARASSMQGLRHGGAFGLEALTEIAKDQGIDDWGREVAAQEAQLHLWEREDQHQPQPGFVRTEYGPPDSRVVREIDYRKRRGSRPSHAAESG